MAARSLLSRHVQKLLIVTLGVSSIPLASVVLPSPALAAACTVTAPAPSSPASPSSPAAPGVSTPPISVTKPKPAPKRIVLNAPLRKTHGSGTLRVRVAKPGKYYVAVNLASSSTSAKRTIVVQGVRRQVRVNPHMTTTTKLQVSAKTRNLTITIPRGMSLQRMAVRAVTTTKAPATLAPRLTTGCVNGSWVSGVFPGRNPTAAGAAAFSALRGGPVDLAVVYPLRDNWKTFATNQWAVDVYSGFAGQLSLSVPLTLNDGTQSSLAQIAAGAHDADFRTWAKGVVDRGRGSSIVRLGWEFNGNWMAWSAYDAATYKAAYRHVVGVLRSVSPNFIFDWCGNLGVSQAGHNPFTELYPGNDVVDIVGVDAYDTQWLHVSDAASWNRYLNSEGGLNQWAAFAVAHGKKLSVPEWGLDVNGGKDNPYYVDQMHAWFSAQSANLAYEAYFDEAADYIRSALGSGLNPRSTAEYATLF